MRANQVRWLLVLLACSLGGPTVALGAGPVEALVKLAPPDAAATLVIEDLRGHAREFLASPLADDLASLPAVQGWLASEGYQRFDRARREIETALGANLTEVRDALLGDAVVLSLHVPPETAVDDATGLLLVRVRDRDLLNRLIAMINAVERQKGDLVELISRRHGSHAYTVRRFQPGIKPTEYYAILDGETFAWSNSESLLHGVIDRRNGAPGLRDQAVFQEVWGRLPDRALVRLFVDPRFLERLLEEVPTTDDDEPWSAGVLGLVRRYLEALRFAGAALQWREGVVLHIHEALDPEQLDEPLRRWAAGPGRAVALARRAPASALALAVGHVDLGAVYDMLWNLVPEEERPRAELVITTLRGLLLDRDPRDEVLPYLGPDVLAFVDAQRDADAWLPTVIATVVADDPDGSGHAGSVAAALENALRTAMAFHALDPVRRDLDLRLETHHIGEVRVTSLVGRDRRVFAYALGGGVLALGNSSHAVGAFCSADPDTPAHPRFEALRDAYFPEARSYLVVDLQTLHQAAETQKDALADALNADRDDLDQVLALLGLFQGAFATSTIEPDFSAVHRTLGLVARKSRSQR